MARGMKRHNLLRLALKEAGRRFVYPLYMEGKRGEKVQHVSQVSDLKSKVDYGPIYQDGRRLEKDFGG